MKPEELELLDELLDQWEEARQQGRQLTAEELCASHNSDDVLVVLRERIAALGEMDSRLRTQPFLNDEHVPASETLVDEQGNQIAQALSARSLDPDKDLGPDAEPFSQHRYKILQHLAAGGLGTVFEALDQQLNRKVVVKLIRRRHAFDPELHNRFRIEREITGRMEHPGIVPVYGIGELPDGRLFYVMRKIEAKEQGNSLKEAAYDFHARRLELTPSGRRIALHKMLTSFVTACRTVACAHNRGIINRDLKPEHIMMGKFGETLVVDWGLATKVERKEQFKVPTESTILLGEDTSPSHSCGGTLMFMSPEQALGNTSLEPATDIFSLGATLYFLLTAANPYKGKTIAEVRQQLIGGDFPRPTEVYNECPKPLEAICLKAMSKYKKDRYKTAQELADDIERYLADEPVSVLPETRADRLLRWTRHHQTTALVGLVSLLTVLILMVVASLSLVRANAVANHAQLATLDTSAAFAAKMLGNEVEHRWQVLEIAARDPRLQQMIGKWDQTPEAERKSFDHQMLDNWLGQQREQFDGCFSDPAYSWVITDAKGIQIGRKADDHQTFHGKSFAQRTYFHGGERELEPHEVSTAKPIEKPFLTTVYQNKSTENGKPILTANCVVPIFAGGDPSTGKVIGVLGMSFPIRQSKALALPNEDHYVMLMDLRPDWDDKPGLVLFDGRQAAGKRGDRTLADHVDPDSVEFITDLGARGQTHGVLSSKFRLGTDSAPASAAFSQVVTTHGKQDFKTCGWVVIVCEATR